ncbi:hypothetical protein DL98DRAFT_636612 [Cadophora sp. DSE1049]|nr:hypothetical protein DL98DRAFT_636612 [Cadophora sp. DSE1049]
MELPETKIAVPLCCKQRLCRHRRRAMKLAAGKKTVYADWEYKNPKPPNYKGSPCVLSRANFGNLPVDITYKIFKEISARDAVSLGKTSKNLYAGLRNGRPKLVRWVTGIAPKDSKANLGNLPYDIIYKIFKLCSLNRAVSLGLTSTRLYGFLKMAHPTPIILDGVGRFDLIPACFGRYHLVPHQFLNANVYGVYPTDKDRALEFRYKDWATASVDGKKWWQVGFKSFLPYPHMMGDDWNVEALKIIKQSVKHFRCKTQFVKFWKRCRVFNQHGPVEFPERVVNGKLSDKRAAEKKARCVEKVANCGY